MKYQYKAVDAAGVIQTGMIEASSPREASDLLLQKSLNPLSLVPEMTAKRKRGVRAPMFLTGSLSLFDQVIITRHLGTILNAGTDLPGALLIIESDAIKPLVKEIMHDVRTRVVSGESLSSALGHWSLYFSPVLLNLVKAGEASGNLSQILVDYSKELRKDYGFERKVKGALFYPILLIAMLAGMMILMLSTVIPKLKSLFTGTNIPVPFYTKFLFLASDFWLHNTWPIVFTTIVLLVIFIFSMRDPRIKMIMSTIQWHIPILNKIQKSATLFQFTKTLAALLRAGIDLKAAVLITGGSTALVYQPVLTKIGSENLEKGISLSESLRKYPDLFPELLANLIATGEKTGQLVGILDQMAEFYEEDVVYALEQFLTVLEPVLIIVVGGVIGLIFGSLISSIYRFIGGVA